MFDAVTLCSVASFIVELRNRNLSAVESLPAAASSLSVKSVVNQCQSQFTRTQNCFAVYNSHPALMTGLPVLIPFPATQPNASLCKARHNRHHRYLSGPATVAGPLARSKPTLATCHDPEASSQDPHSSGRNSYWLGAYRR